MGRFVLNVVRFVRGPFCPWSVMSLIPKLHMDEWGFSILRPFHQYYNYNGTLKGDRGDNDKGACNGASSMSLNA